VFAREPLDLAERLHKVAVLEDLVELELVDDVGRRRGLEPDPSGFLVPSPPAAAPLLRTLSYVINGYALPPIT
jgi:hypothetical protein